MYKGASDGEHSDLHINGKVRCKYAIKNGNIDKGRTCYYNNGNLWVVEKFNNGMFDGTNFLLTKKQDTVYIEEYKMDTLLYSKNFEYYRNQAIKTISEVWYTNDSTLTKNPFKTRKKLSGVKINLIETESNINNTRIVTYFDKSGKIELMEEYVRSE
jgi:hypothetical protein